MGICVSLLSALWRFASGSTQGERPSQESASDASTTSQIAPTTFDSPKATMMEPPENAEYNLMMDSAEQDGDADMANISKSAPLYIGTSLSSNMPYITTRSRLTTAAASPITQRKNNFRFRNKKPKIHFSLIDNYLDLIRGSGADGTFREKVRTVKPTEPAGPVTAVDDEENVVPSLGSSVSRKTPSDSEPSTEPPEPREVSRTAHKQVTGYVQRTDWDNFYRNLKHSPKVVDDVDLEKLVSSSDQFVVRPSTSKIESLGVRAQIVADLLILKERQDEERRIKELEEEERKQLAASGGFRRPKRNFISPLSEEMLARVQATLHARPNQELAKTPEGTALHRKDFGTVVPPNIWLNDEIVNGTLLHMQNHINEAAGITNLKTQTPKVLVLNSFFSETLLKSGVAKTERMMRRMGVKKDTFLDMELVIFPICRGAHWTLMAVFPQSKEYAHLNSMGSGLKTIESKTLEWIESILQDKYLADEWHQRPFILPQQQNSDDCGVCAITNGMCLSLGINPSVSYRADQLNLQRRRIAAVLLNSGFSGELSVNGI